MFTQEEVKEKEAKEEVPIMEEDSRTPTISPKSSRKSKVGSSGAVSLTPPVSPKTAPSKKSKSKQGNQLGPKRSPKKEKNSSRVSSKSPTPKSRGKSPKKSVPPASSQEAWVDKSSHGTTDESEEVTFEGIKKDFTAWPDIPDLEMGYDRACSEVKEQGAPSDLHVVDNFSGYSGETIEDKINTFIKTHSVVIISKSLCAFCRDVKDLLGSQIGVKCHIIEVNLHPQGNEIFNYVKRKYDSKTVPLVFVKGDYIGGCDTCKALHAKKELESKVLNGLIVKNRTTGTHRLETSKLVPVERSTACHPLFWFPNVVNNYIIRVVGFQVCALSVLSAAFLKEKWAHWLAAGVLIDFVLRFVAGSSASPLGMTAAFVTSFFRPQFRPGPPKQFASGKYCTISFKPYLLYTSIKNS